MARDKAGTEIGGPDTAVVRAETAIWEGPHPGNSERVDSSAEMALCAHSCYCHPSLPGAVVTILPHGAQKQLGIRMCEPCLLELG